MPEEKLRPNYSFDQDRIEQLRAIVPEAFADGNINWDVLREALGEYLEPENSETEHFGLFWPGKREARRLASIPSTGTLAPCIGEGIDEDKTHNIFIEGDNLEVLKLLQKSYAGQVKVVYVDPPYNTGSDFIYNDVFEEPLDQYLRQTGQLDEEGILLTTNPKSSGRFHTNWLNMMYPRLRLARNLLKEEGVIFISIDDNEISKLKELTNEVFGEENFVGLFTVNTTPNARDYGHIGKMHEYVLFYAKNIAKATTFLIPEVERQFKYSDEKGGFNIHPLYNSNVAFNSDNRPNLHYPFYLHADKPLTSEFFEIGLENKGNSVEIYPPKSQKEGSQFVWRWGKQKSQQNLNKEIIGYKTNSGEYRIVQKMRHSEKLIRSLLIDKCYSTRRGTAEVEECFGEKIFSFPKPLELLRKLVFAGSSNNDLVLDIFAGSCTTAHVTCPPKRSPV